MNPKNKYTSSLNKFDPFASVGNTFKNNITSAQKAISSSSNVGSVSPTSPTLPPAGQQYVNNLTTQQTPQTNIQTSPQIQPTQEKPKTAYDKYIESLTSDTNKAALEKKTADAQRLADIQSRNEKQYLNTVSGRENILDTPGGLKIGAQESANMFTRRASAESAYGAIEEGAAARTAGVSRDAYNDAIAQGKTAYEAELEQEKANKKEGFTLGEGQTRYEINPATGQYEAISGGGSDTGGIYTVGANPEADAYVKMVQLGTLKLDNVPQNIRGVVAQGLSSQPEADDPKKQYVKTQAKEALTNIDTALGYLTGEKSGAINTAGTAIGRAIGGFIPGSDVANLNAALDTVKALVGFDALQKMRDSSPTGGALGQITERELSFLQSVQGSLKTTQGTDQLISTINRVKQSFQTLQIINSPDGTPFELNGETYIKQGNQMLPSSSFKSAGNASASNRPQRNSNPLNIKASSATSSYNGVKGIDPIPASDGGNFLVFETPEAGFNAAKKLIQADSYKNLSVDAALRRWSGNGYGAEIAPKLAGKKINQLTSGELDSLVKTMAKREGYYA